MHTIPGVPHRKPSTSSRGVIRNVREGMSGVVVCMYVSGDIAVIAIFEVTSMWVKIAESERNHNLSFKVLISRVSLRASILQF